MTRRTFFFVTLSIIFITLLVNNTIYYFLARDTLRENLIKHMETQADQIQISIENSRTAARYLEASISENLRSVSIAVQQQLDPDIEKVSNEQLVELSKKFKMDSITLMKDTGDDIVLYKSSEPHEIGLSTKSWKPWYQAFRQLLSDHKVSIDWGERLPNFWAGPFEYSSAEPNSQSLKKYGYYFDGSTNFIIDPFVNDEAYLEFQDNGGLNAIIEKTLNREHTTLIDVTAFNPITFGTDEMKTELKNGGLLSHSTPRPIIFGDNNYASSEDIVNVKKVAQTLQPFTTFYSIDGSSVVRSYFPINITPSADITDKEGNRLSFYIMALTSEHSEIQSALKDQFTTLIVEITIVSVLSIAIISLIVLFILKRRDKDVKATQLAYIEDVNHMFTAIKGQRHDLLNHIHTVYSLINLEKYDEVKRYANELVEDIMETNDIITIGQPAIAALIQSKVVAALQRKITFRHDFDNLTDFPLGLKSVDLVRIIGNLIDNAFDAVQQFEDDRRKVEVQGYVRHGVLHISVSNPGELSGDNIATTIFTPGYTTKKEKHAGLGLAVTKQLVQKYRGTLSLNTQKLGTIEFKVTISLN